MQKDRHCLLDRLIVPRQGNAFYFWDSQSREYQSISYEDLYHKSSLLAQDLSQAGMSRQPLMITFPQGLEFVQVVLACLMANVVFIPLHQIRTKAHLSLLQSMASSSLTPWVLSPYSLGDIAEFKGKIGAFFLQEIPLSSRGGQNVEDICFLQYSSGTTHKPKGVMITHQNLLACLEKMTRMMNITQEDHGCIWLPPYQDLGIIGGVFLPLYAGFPLTLMSSRTFILNPLKWLEVMTEQKVTITAAPNFAYDMCVDRLKPQQTYHFDLLHLRIALNGAELVKARTIDRFTQSFQSFNFNPKAFYPAYGLTEATLMVTASSPLEVTRRVHIPSVAPYEIVSCGKPMADINVKIIKQGRELKPLQVGEIWIAGETIAKGYWNDVPSTSSKFDQTLGESFFDIKSYVKSGDLGFMDHDGYLYVLGRLDDQVCIKGVSYLAESIEDVVLARFQQGAIYKIVAFTASSGEVTILCEAPRQWERLVPLLSQAAQDLWKIYGLENVVIALVKRGEIPVTTNGKIKRHAAQILYQYGVIDTFTEKRFDFRAGLELSNP